MRNQNLVVLQARMSSSRLPGKAMMEINGMPMIYWQVQRILRAKNVNSLVVATSIDSTDDSLVNFLDKNSIDVYRGSLDNVLSRFVEVAELYPYDAIIRLTGDCPLAMPELIDKMVVKFYEHAVDYLSNTLEPTFPDGLDIEIVKSSVFKKLWTFKLEPKELEHVTYGIYTRPETFNLSNFPNESNHSHERWTVDYQEDLDFIRKVYAHFAGHEPTFTYLDLFDFLRQKPEVISGIDAARRNEQLHKE